MTESLFTYSLFLRLHTETTRASALEIHFNGTQRLKRTINSNRPNVEVTKCTFAKRKKKLMKIVSKKRNKMYIFCRKKFHSTISIRIIFIVEAFNFEIFDMKNLIKLIFTGVFRT